MQLLVNNIIVYRDCVKHYKKKRIKKLQRHKGEMKQRLSSKAPGQLSELNVDFRGKKFRTTNVQCALELMNLILMPMFSLYVSGFNAQVKVCAKWMHRDCFNVDDDLYICGLYENVFQ